VRFGMFAGEPRSGLPERDPLSFRPFDQIANRIARNGTRQISFEYGGQQAAICLDLSETHGDQYFK
jgi:hypothetical protein